MSSGYQSNYPPVGPSSQKYSAYQPVYAVDAAPPPYAPSAPSGGAQQPVYAVPSGGYGGYGVGYGATAPPAPGYGPPQSDKDAKKPLHERPRGSSIDGAAQFDYSASVYRDKGWLFFFVLHLVAMIVCAASFGGSLIRDISDDSQNDEYDDSSYSNQKNALIILALSPLIGGILGAAWLSIMQRYSASIIKLSMMLNVAFLSAGIVVAVIQGVIVLAIIYAIILLFAVLYYFAVRNRIPFAQATLEVAVEAIKQESGPVYVTYGIALVQIVWVVFWAFTTLAVFHELDESSASGGEKGFVYFLLLVSLYWTQQVLKNVAHVTTAGVVASWWLVPELRNPTSGAFKRATTTSFGSICFGSFVVAFLEAVRAIVRMAKQKAQERGNCLVVCVLCIVECWLQCLENLIRYFNKYAYTQIAIYGKDFMSAAKDTWSLFQARGFEMIINDDLTGMVLMMGCLVGAVLTGLFGGIWAYSIDSSSNVWLPIGLICFAIGFIMVLLTMTVIESAVATTYVVLAEDPHAMSRNRPAQYNNLRTAANQAYPHLGL